MSRQHGFSLLETLVATLLLGIGLLGLAGLQSSQSRLIQLADQHSRAALAVQALAARMRVNPAGLRGNAYHLACGVTPPAATDCRASSCSPAELAAWDVASSLASLRGDDDGVPVAPRPLDAPSVEPLPGVHLTIACSADCASSLHRVTLCWRTEPGAQVTDCQPAPGTACFQLTVQP